MNQKQEQRELQERIEQIVRRHNERQLNALKAYHQGYEGLGGK